MVPIRGMNSISCIHAEKKRFSLYISENSRMHPNNVYLHPSEVFIRTLNISQTRISASVHRVLVIRLVYTKYILLLGLDT